MKELYKPEFKLSCACALGVFERARVFFNESMSVLSRHLARVVDNRWELKKTPINHSRFLWVSGANHLTFEGEGVDWESFHWQEFFSDWPTREIFFSVKKQCMISIAAHAGSLCFFAWEAAGFFFFFSNLDQRRVCMVRLCRMRQAYDRPTTWLRSRNLVVGSIYTKQFVS